MRFNEVMSTLASLPLFRSGHLYAGADKPQKVQRQLADWVRGSYVSLQSALSYYDLIPERVAVVTSVTRGRPGTWQNPDGHFSYQHIKPAVYFSFSYRQVTQTQWVYMATPEKALLDLVYLTPDADSEGYVRALRLQNLDQLDAGRLTAYVTRIGKPELKRALAHILRVAAVEATEYEPL